MHGVIAAVPTQICEHGKSDTTPFLAHFAWALENSCDEPNVLGSTGGV